jgi:hypothetical protein
VKNRDRWSRHSFDIWASRPALETELDGWHQLPGVELGRHAHLGQQPAGVDQGHALVVGCAVDGQNPQGALLTAATVRFAGVGVSLYFARALVNPEILRP